MLPSWSRPWGGPPGLVAGALVLLLVVTTFWHRDQGFEDLSEDTTLDQRIATINAGLAMFADHPILGVGLGGPVIGWPQYAPAGSLAKGWLHTHNTYVQVLV